MKEESESIERRKLLEAGWKPKEKEDGRTIWRNPENGFWYPQRVAIALLGKNENSEDILEEPEGEA